MPYLTIKIKQLIADNTDKFEVAFDPGTEKEFAVPVEFFALCDLVETPCQGEEDIQFEEYIGVILPVTFSEDGGLEATLTSEYKLSDEQEVCLREKVKG